MGYLYESSIAIFIIKTLAPKPIPPKGQRIRKHVLSKEIRGHPLATIFCRVPTIHLTSNQLRQTQNADQGPSQFCVGSVFAILLVKLKIETAKTLGSNFT